MIDAYNIHKILSLIGVFFGTFLGLWVYYSDKKSKINKYFALMFLSFSIFWIHQFYTTSFLAGVSTDLAIWNLRIGISGAAVTMFALFHFCIYFPRESAVPSLLKTLVLYLSIFLVIFSLSPFLINGVSINNEGVLQGQILGWGKYIYYPVIMFIVLSALFIAVKKYFSLDIKEKIKTKFFLWGLSIGIIGNVIGNILFPIFKNILHPIGNYSLLIFLTLTTLAITGYRLFEIKVLLTEILVGIMGVILFIMPFVSGTTPAIKILMAGVFLVYCVIGYLLLKSTWREMKQKEVLEDIVRERTKNLNEKIKELDRWYHLTVGRELRMAELKGEIGELKEKLKNQ